MSDAEIAEHLQHLVDEGTVIRFWDPESNEYLYRLAHMPIHYRILNIFRALIKHVNNAI